MISGRCFFALLIFEEEEDRSSFTHAAVQFCSIEGEEQIFRNDDAHVLTIHSQSYALQAPTYVTSKYTYFLWFTTAVSELRFTDA